MILKKNTAGFTLVEIMIVVAIIGLLAAIAVPNFMQARTNARKNACINNLRLIDAAAEQWAMENNADTGDAVTLANVSAYLKNNALPNADLLCPASGTYAVTVVGAKPTCTVAGHAL